MVDNQEWLFSTNLSVLSIFQLLMLSQHAPFSPAIANKVTQNYQTGYKQSALNKAAMRSLNCTKILIEKGGANPYLLVDSISILETAILFGRMDVASYLVDSCEMSLSAPSGFYKNGKRIYDVLKIADCSKGDSLNLQLKKKLLRQLKKIDEF